MKKLLMALAVAACMCFMSMDPDLDKTDIFYTVQTGDTVWHIAERYADCQVKPFNEFVFEIQERNQLAGRYIIPGDVLVIPLYTRAKK